MGKESKPLPLTRLRTWHTWRAVAMDVEEEELGRLSGVELAATAGGAGRGRGRGYAWELVAADPEEERDEVEDAPCRRQILSRRSSFPTSCAALSSPPHVPDRARRNAFLASRATPLSPPRVPGPSTPPCLHQLAHWSRA